MSLASRLFGILFKLPAAETYDVVVERDIKIPMSDGVNLLADRYYPRKAARLPLVLVRSPYGRGHLFGIQYGRLFAERGFQALIQSCRGTFGSGGEFVPFFDEHKDGLDTVEWIKKQEWFNGELATVGGSYLGYTQWAIAADAGPTLKAMSVGVTASQFRGQTYPGDAFSLRDPLSWTYQVNIQETASPLSMSKMMFGGASELNEAFWHLPLGTVDELLIGKKVDFWKDWLANSEPDFEWWQPADFGESVGQVDFPVDMVSGWYDIFLPWQIDDYMTLKSAGHQPCLSIGPWAHTSMVGLTGYSIRQALAFLDAQLKNQKEMMRQLPVHVFVMGLKKWKDFDEWPPKEYLNEWWYLQPGKRLATETPIDSEPDLYVYDPGNPTPAVGGVMMSVEAGSRDNRKLEARPDVLTFTSEAMEQDTEVIGPVAAELYIKSNRQYADFFVRVCDVHPSGKSMNVCDGIRRIRPDRPASEPDGTIKVKIELWPTAYRFKRGHRIRVQVSSGAFPRFARNLGTGQPLATGVDFLKAEQEIYHDPAHPSAIILPTKRYI